MKLFGSLYIQVRRQQMSNHECRAMLTFQVSVMKRRTREPQELEKHFFFCLYCLNHSVVSLFRGVQI